MQTINFRDDASDPSEHSSDPHTYQHRNIYRFVLSQMTPIQKRLTLTTQLDFFGVTCCIQGVSDCRKSACVFDVVLLGWEPFGA